MTAPRFDRVIPPDWADHNGHMNEARYLQAISAASDALLDAVGVGPAQVARGASVFTAETHLWHLAEARAGQRLTVRSRLLARRGAELWLWHDLAADGAPVAEAEQRLVHVDLATRARTDPAPDVARALDALRDPGPAPRRAGRGVRPPGG